MRALPCLVLVSLSLSCGGREAAPAESQSESPTTGETLDLDGPAEHARRFPSFERYWYQGSAELARYDLTQQRYGSPREGHAVLIFVTEPFLPDAQVKHELEDGRDDVSVLKLNHYRRFYTGIYPYTALTSTFGAVDHQGEALKSTATVTEWCGQAFTQLNRRDGGWAMELRSYFQAEGDQDEQLESAPLEDSLFIRGRFGAEALPTGDSLSLIPALHYLRFRHQPVKPYAASASVDRARDETYGAGELVRYEVRYPQLGRTLVIFFEPAFPFDVLGWEERQEGEEGVTRAVRTHAIVTDYWSHNGPEDDAYREALGL